MNNTSDIDKQIEEANKRLEESIKNSKKKSEKFIQSLSPEKRAQWLKGNEDFKREQELRYYLELGLSYDDLFLRKVLLNFQDLFYRLRSNEKFISWMGQKKYLHEKGKCLWDYIGNHSADMSELKPEDKQLVDDYLKKKEVLYSVGHDLYELIKHHSISKMASVLLEDEKKCISMIGHFNKDFGEKYNEYKKSHELVFAKPVIKKISPEKMTELKNSYETKSTKIREILWPMTMDKYDSKK